jgi:hypothetical protein
VHAEDVPSTHWLEEGNTILKSVRLAGLLVTGLGLGLAHAQTTAPDAAAGAPPGCFGVTDGPEKNPSVTGKRTKRWRKTTRGKIEGRSGSLNGALSAGRGYLVVIRPMPSS